MQITADVAIERLISIWQETNLNNRDSINSIVALLQQNFSLPKPSQPSDNLRKDIIDTCKIIEIIDELDNSKLSLLEVQKLAHLRNSCVHWLKPYIATDPEQRRFITDIIQNQNNRDFPWAEIRPSSKGLALLYNFSPFQDTGASVASKRLRNFGISFDVIACSFLHKKKMDETIEKIAEPYVNRKYFLPLAPSWASWEPFKAFATQASDLAEQFMTKNGGYDFIYTRAMWAPSIYAGFKFKINNPEISWVTEFSDPLSLDVEGLNRGGAIPLDDFSLEIISNIENIYGDIPDEKKTVFALAEYAAYAFADEIIFTNSHQKTTMLEHIHDDKLRERVDRISIVDNHPTLPNEYYQIESASYSVKDNVLNLAYFGEFYSSRGITEVTSAIRSLPEDFSRKVHLHVFTNYIPPSKGNRRPRQFSQAQYNALVQRAHEGVGAHDIEDQVHMNASLPYLEFLATTNIFDYLIVNDARSGAHHAINPYLPSKWSDYYGSKAKTWGFVEEGSILSTKPIDVKTEVSNAWDARLDLWNMIIEKFPELEKEH